MKATVTATGPEFRDRRKKMGMTQERLAENFGMTRQTIASLEKDGKQVGRVYVLALMMLEADEELRVRDEDRIL